MQYFNHYAFVVVAIYGKSFWEAAKEIFELLNSSGVYAIVNDNIIGTVLLMGSLTGAIITGIFGGALSYYALDSDDWLLIGFVSAWVYNHDNRLNLI
jgi:hypothetical protein